MEKSKNKRANNLLWYAVGLCVVVITLTSVFMSANKKEESGLKNTDSLNEYVTDKTENTDKSEEAMKTEDEPKTDSSEDTCAKAEESKDANAEETQKPETPAKPTSTEKETFELPVNGYISKEYSVDVPVYSLTMNDYRAHTGIDVLCEEGSAVTASAAGTVKQVYNDPMMGTTVVIEHNDGISTRYMNLNETLADGITSGASVVKGQLIGAVGSSALVEVAQDPHLHFEVTVSGAYVDPLTILDPSTVTVMSDSVIE